MDGIKDLKEEVKTRPLDFLQKYFPNGKLNGDEYELGDVNGNPGQSLRFNIKKLAWSDFSTEQKGWGFITLYAASIGTTEVLAERELMKAEGNVVVVDAPSRPAPPPPLPIGVPPNIEKFQHWLYTDKKGIPVLFIKRVDRKDGKKEFYPFRWNEEGRFWEGKCVPRPLPLYNLPAVTKNEQVIVVEGEKAADALQDAVGKKCAVTTWPNGVPSVEKADWKSLKEKSVILWPDNDPPGHSCMQKLAGILANKFHVEQIFILEVGDLKPKADAADCSFKNPNEFFRWANDRSKKFESQKQLALIEDTLEEVGTSVEAVKDSSFPASTVAKAKGLTRGNSGQLHANYNNVYRTIEQEFKEQFWWDEFYQTPMTSLKVPSPVPVTNEKVCHLLGILQCQGYPRLGSAAVEQAIKAYVKNPHTPNRNMKAEGLARLEWDKTPRVRDFLHTYMGAPKNQYTEAVSQNFLVSIVARTVKPGAKVDNMLVLEGPQGAAKGKALEALVGEDFHSEESGRFDEELVSRMMGKQIMEYSELASVTGRNFEYFKSFLTRRKDRVRRKWSKDAEDINRTAICVGTTNKETYIYDNTGGRRFWPVEVDNVDYLHIEKDRDQLFAEAYELYKSGASWWEVPEQAEKEQYRRRSSDPWENQLRERLQTARARGVMEADVQSIGIGYLNLEKRDLNERTAGRIERMLRLFGYRRESDERGKIFYKYSKEY